MSQNRTLFRPEAVAYQGLRQAGAVAMLRPVATTVLFWCLAAVVALMATFLAFAQYARKETVVGSLAPTAGVAKVFASRTGIITAVHVREGETVEAGQPMLTVAIDQTTADGKNVDAVLLDTLGRQKTALREQIAMQAGRAASERRRLEAQIAGAREAITHLDAQIAAQAERIRLSASIVRSVEGLRGKGYISEVDYTKRRESLIENKQRLSALNQQVAARRTELAQATAALEQLPATISDKVQSLRNLVAETEQRLAEIDGRRAFVVRAPVAGRISTMQAAVGRAVEPRQLQLSILPHDSVLQAELFVPARAIGFVRAGQEVRVLYDAFPYQHFGTYRGRVTGVARTMLMGADLPGPVSLQQPAYKVTVALDRQDVTAYGARVALQPDMLLKADILLDRRPLLAWLLDSLLSARVS
ncbi:MAG: HlyD family efflux transporter periplasmic adaptor subunit [Xanthobacteraceae bacterium]